MVKSIGAMSVADGKCAKIDCSLVPEADFRYLQQVIKKKAIG